MKRFVIILLISCFCSGPCFAQGTGTYEHNIKKMSLPELERERAGIRRQIQKYKNSSNNFDKAFVATCEKHLRLVNAEIARRPKPKNQVPENRADDALARERQERADRIRLEEQRLKQRAYEAEMARTQSYYDNLKANAAYHASAEGVAVASAVVDPSRYMNPGQVNYIPSETPRVQSPNRRVVRQRLQHLRSVQYADKNKDEVENGISDSVLQLYSSLGQDWSSSDFSQKELDSLMKSAYERFKPIDTVFLKRLDGLSQDDLRVWEANYQEYVDFAALAGNCYEDSKNGCPEGWKKVDDPDLFALINAANDNHISFHCELYEFEYEEHGLKKTKYALGFAGTDSPSEMFGEWGPGARDRQSILAMGQTEMALETAGKIIEVLKKQYGDDLNTRFCFVGHSLGGRLAGEAAIKYGFPANTYNAAGVSLETKEQIQSNSKMAANAGLITNIVSCNDALTYFQDGVPKVLDEVEDRVALDKMIEITDKHVSLAKPLTVFLRDYRMPGARIEITDEAKLLTGEGHGIKLLFDNLKIRKRMISDRLASISKE